MIDLAAAHHAEHRHLALQAADREPGLAARGILAGSQRYSRVKDEEAPGLDQQTRHEGVVVVEREEAVEIEPARLRHPRMLRDRLEAQMRRATRQAIEFGISHGPAPTAPHC